MPTLLDMGYVFALIVLATIFEHYYFWPRFRAETAAGDPGARVRGYRRGIVGQWAFAALCGVIWMRYDRPLNTIGLARPLGVQMIVSIALVALMIALVGYQYLSVIKLPVQRRIAARPRLGSVQFLLPHTHREFRWFLLLSVTAGFCEELIYRGYLVWFLSRYIGLTGAYLGVIALFGIGHAYQGKKGAIKATVAGVVMTGIVALTGWLVPAMIIHALVDAGSGTVGYLLLRDDADAPNSAALEPVQPLLR